MAALFARYFEILRENDAYSRGFADLRRLLVRYNSESHLVKLAMAPAINITDFVIDNLQGATRVVIRQFLISPKNKKAEGQDIIRFLCWLSDRERADIEIYLDEEMYEKQWFVQDAVSELVRHGCKVFTQRRVKVINTEGECCIHDKLILATLHNGILRTMIGSAGFTIDVIANRNAENFICIDAASVYHDLMDHHARAIGRDDVQVTRRGVLHRPAHPPADLGRDGDRERDDRSAKRHRGERN